MRQVRLMFHTDALLMGYYAWLFERKRAAYIMHDSNPSRFTFSATSFQIDTVIPRTCIGYPSMAMNGQASGHLPTTI